MNRILFILLFSFSSSFASACDTDTARKKLVEMFKLSSNPSTDWIAIKKSNKPSKKYRKNRAFPIEVQATRRISSSKIIFKRVAYDLSDAKVCMEDGRVLVSHKEYGELYVSRKGSDMASSYIRLKQKGGIFSFQLRPSPLVK